MTGVVRIDPRGEEDLNLWGTVVELAQVLEGNDSWCLIGGLMVQLRVHEHGAAARPTRDIDLLGDSRRRPSATEELADVLSDLGADAETPSATDPKLGYRFRVGDQRVEVLGPEGLKRPAKTLGQFETVEVRGGTQALRRAEIVLVSVAGEKPTPIRVPSLVGGVLLKARALGLSRRKFDEHRQDLINLLSFVDDPRRVAAEDLAASERGWLAAARKELRLSDPGLADRFAAEWLERAWQVLDLLVGD